VAQMYPTPMDPTTDSQAEQRLYALFQEQLDDSYVVFHSVTWLWPDNRGNACDGEADFVIAHPTQGVLVLEVKGGGIARDMRKGRWTSTNYKGETFEIKDPIKQAKANKNKLLAVLRTSLKKYIVIGHAVAFPDILTQSQRLGPDLPPEILLDLSHLSSLGAWVKRAMRYWWREELPERRLALEEQGILTIISILGKQWKFRPALWGQLTDEHQELVHLTQQQYMILDVLNHQHHALISGFAGSGKTMLALEKAVRLERQGFRVLLLCYNSQLAQELRARVSWGINLYIYHFHELCMKIAQETGMEDIIMDARSEEYFRTVLPQALRGSAQRQRVIYPASLPRTYNAIIVDEGQDFYEEWWSALQELFPQGQENIFYIFYDNTQRLYPTPLIYPITSAPYLLTVNCRTTQAIHHQFMRFYPGTETCTARGPQGRPPVFIHYPTGELQHTMEATVTRLMQEQGIPLKEMMILTPYSRQKSHLRSVKDLMSWSNEKDQAFISTIHSAKGLERPVVLLAELERRFPSEKQIQELETYLYIACSRAQLHLIILLTKPLPRFLREIFAQ
jgi:hypothetical protein